MGFTWLVTSLWENSKIVLKFLKQATLMLYLKYPQIPGLNVAPYC